MKFRSHLSRGAFITACFLFGISILSHGAADWTTWDRDSGNVRLADGHFAPDGKLRVLFVEDVTITDSSRLVKLATLEGGTFQVETIEEVGLITDSAIAHSIRLVGDQEKVWALWRKDLGTGSPTIRATQIYPRSGPLNLETVDSGNSFNRYDACIGADGFPRVAFINTPNFGITVLRRTASGNWQTKTTLPLTPFGEKIYREISLTSQNNQLNLFLVTNENSFGGASAPYLSELTHHSATEPATWSSLSFASPEIIDSASFDPELTFANGLEAAWNGSDSLAITYANFAESSGRLAIRSTSGTWATHDFVDLPAGPVFGTDLAVALDGNIHLTWSNSVNRLQHVVWNGSSFDPVNEVNGITAFRADLEVDERGVPWFTSRSTDGAKLYVSTPTDTTDEDGDGVIFLVEEALKMNPLVPDSEKLPSFELIETGGQTYLSLSYFGQGGGAGDNPYRSSDFDYFTEVSDNLQVWSPALSDVVLQDRFTITGRGTVNIYRSTVPFGTQAKQFIRVRVVRR